MEAIGALAGGVAHDFNNLLTIIIGYAQLLLDEADPEHPMRAQIEEITKAAERGAGLTAQLLAFSRKQDVRPKVLDLSSVTCDLQKMLGRMIGEDIRLVIIAGTGLGRVRVDRLQIEQVLLNLALNARDAMPRGGTLTIETSNFDCFEAFLDSDARIPAGSYVLLSLTDTGCGMDEATRARIFEPFFTTKECGKGTGLGLSTVYGIVKQCGGEIAVSSSPSRGTTFRIYLARTFETADQSDMPRVLPAAVSPGRTVLLVEDDEGVRRLTARLLREAGYAVLEASDGTNALTACESHRGRIDLLLTDVVMPNMSGPELAEKIGAAKPHMAVLYMSGYTDNQLGNHGVLRAGVELLKKPFKPAALLEKIRSMIASSAATASVLVADDDPDVRKMIRGILESGGYEVGEACNGKEVMHQIDKRRVDLLITDLVMPEQEGLETIRSLRSRGFDCKIIAISGAFGGEWLNVASLLGADLVMQKPIVPHVLLSTVRQVLAV
jgi:CheY-like chemotaxis protein